MFENEISQYEALRKDYEEKVASRIIRCSSSVWKTVPTTSLPCDKFERRVLTNT